jgi:curved DNA-binding protein CbpA
MDEPLPDHYAALGVDKNADTSTIKKAHRALVLTCHPDKVTVTDPAVKQQKAEQFHCIQKAYEVLTDESERSKYEALRTLEALRKEKLARGPSSSSREKSTRFDSRPSASTSSRYATEERRPSAAYDADDRYYDDRERERERTRGSTRGKYDTKYETYAAYPKAGASPRADKETSKSTKATAERSRADRTKTRDKEERRDRSDRTDRKFVSPDSESSSADEKARFQKEYKRRSQEDDAQRRAADGRAADARRKEDDYRRSYEEPPRHDAARKMSSQAEDAMRYLQKSRVAADARPAMVRASSRDYYDGSRSSRKETRPEMVRRSSARPKERVSGRDRDGNYPEIVSWAPEDSSRRPATLKTHASSPPVVESPRATQQRAYTTSEASRDHRSSNSPPPSFSRSQTMPIGQHVPARTKPATSQRPSMLRETMTPEHSSDAYPSVPPPQPSSASKSSKFYHYPTPGGGVPLRQDDISAGGHRTVLREPGSSQRHQSPEPLSRPPMGPNHPSQANISRTAMPPPSSNRASSSPIREDRGRSSRTLYGEVGRDTKEYAPRPRPVRQGSYRPEDVQYTRAYGPEDVKWAPRGRENERDYPSSKPALARAATYVC